MKFKIEHVFRIIRIAFFVAFFYHIWNLRVGIKNAIAVDDLTISWGSKGLGVVAYSGMLFGLTAILLCTLLAMVYAIDSLEPWIVERIRNRYPPTRTEEAS